MRFTANVLEYTPSCYVSFSSIFSTVSGYLR